MRNIIFLTVFLIAACAGASDLVTHYLTLDTATQTKPFEMTITRGSTPYLRVKFLNNNAAITNLSDFGAYVFYATNATASSGVSIGASTMTNGTNGYAFFQFTSDQALGIYSNNTDYPATFWAQVVITNTVGKLYDWSQGRIRIRSGGAIEGASTVVLLGAEADPIYNLEKGAFISTNNLTNYVDKTGSTMSGNLTIGGIRLSTGGNVQYDSSDRLELSDRNLYFDWTIFDGGLTLSSNIHGLGFVGTGDGAQLWLKKDSLGIQVKQYFDGETFTFEQTGTNFSGFAGYEFKDGAISVEDGITSSGALTAPSYYLTDGSYWQANDFRIYGTNRYFKQEFSEAAASHTFSIYRISPNVLGGRFFFENAVEFEDVINMGGNAITNGTLENVSAESMTIGSLTLSSNSYLHYDDLRLSAANRHFNMDVTDDGAVNFKLRRISPNTPATSPFIFNNPIEVHTAFESGLPFVRISHTNVQVGTNSFSLDSAGNLADDWDAGGYSITNGTFIGRIRDDYLENFMSPGRLWGGEIIATNGSNITVASGAGFVKEYPCDDLGCIPMSLSDGLGSRLRYVTWGETNLDLASGYNLIYYDAETDGFAAVLKANVATNNLTLGQDFTVGRVYYDATYGVVSRLCGMNQWGKDIRQQVFHEDIHPVEVGSGGVPSAAGLKIGVTAASVWAEGENYFLTSAKSTNDNFYYWYKLAGVFTNYLTNAISAAVFNNSATGLAPIANNKWRADYVYLVHDGSVHVVMGQNEYLSELAAQDAARPTPPDLLAAYGTLIARVTIEKGATSMTLDAVDNVAFSSAAIPDHNGLSGLQGGAASEYYHLTASDYANVTGQVWSASITGAVASINGLDGVIELEPGSNITITTNGQSLVIASTASGGGTSDKTLGGSAVNWSRLSSQASNVTYYTSNSITYLNFDLTDTAGLYTDTRYILASNITFKALYLTGKANGATGTVGVVFKGHNDGATEAEWHVSTDIATASFPLTNVYATLGTYGFYWGITNGTATNDFRVQSAVLMGTWQ